MGHIDFNAFAANICGIKPREKYGAPATDKQWKAEQQEAAEGYCLNDLFMAVADEEDSLLQALKQGDLMAVGHIINRHRLVTIDRRAELALYGKVITQHEVTA